MARKKSTGETIQPARGAKPARMETFNGKHTITYEAPVNVPVVEPEQDPEAGVIEDEDFEEIEEIQEQPEHREPPLHVRLRQRFRRRGIAGEATLMLRIDRLPNFERDGLAGVRVDKEFCGVITTTEKFFDNDNHLIEIQRRYGPGAYWLTVRYKNAIVDSWRENIGGFPIAASSPAAAPETVSVSPQVIYQPAPNQPQQPIAVQDPLAQMRQAFKLVRELRDDLGLVMPQPPAPAPAAPTDPKIAAIQLIAENPDVMDKIGSGIAKTIFGSKGGDDTDPWAEVAKEAIRSGQAPQIVATLVREVMAPFRNLWGNNNGQAQVAQAPVQNQTRPEQPQQPGQLAPGQEAGQVANPGDASGGMAGNVHRGDHAQVGPLTPEEVQRLVTQPALRIPDAVDLVAQGYISAEDLALMKVIANCQRQINPQKTYNWLMEFANTINDEIPDFSFYDRIDLIGVTPTDQVLDYVRQLPGGEHVTSLSHCKEWTEQLQRVIRESQEGEEE